MTVGAFLGHLVHRGALQQGTDRLLHCPILSFREYLIRRAREPETAVKHDASPARGLTPRPLRTRQRPMFPARPFSPLKPDNRLSRSACPCGE